MTDETEKDRLERYRVEGAAHFIDGIIQGARDKGDAGMLLCAENAEKALRCLRVDKATLRSDLAAAQTRITALEQALATCDGALDGVWRMSLIIESAVRNQEPARSDWISETLKRIPPARTAAKAALDE